MKIAVDINRNLIVDTGYWFPLFDPRDGEHRMAEAKAHHIDTLRVVFPWPTLYETLGTRFVKNKSGMDKFERSLRRPTVQFIDDGPYRDDALEATLREARLGRRAISLCDMLIRLIIQDTNVRIHACSPSISKTSLTCVRASAWRFSE
jgi:predicted nucleic acid-binding protein